MDLEEMRTEVLYDSLVVVCSVSKRGNTKNGQKLDSLIYNVPWILTISELLARCWALILEDPFYLEDQNELLEEIINPSQ